MLPGSRNKKAAGHGLRPPWKERTLRLRARLLGAVREFFTARGYLEVETPILVSAPVPEPHIEFIETSLGVLQPSPEVYMKRLLSAGHPRIFQIARCFRDHERGDRHLPEFTLLEWYRAGTDYWGLMEECEDLVRTVAGRLGVGPALTYLGKAVNLEPPWRRMTVAGAFDRYAPMSLEEALSSGRFDELLVAHVEPGLGMPGPVFLHDYPASMASLSRLRAHDPGVCERVELYMGGMEIANGFSELTDPSEQFRRFQRDVEERNRLGRKAFRIPEAFLDAVKHMPAAAGMALGIDRLVMVLADCRRIDDVVAFTPEDG
ncbi:MAG: EF-P lysine aminoacylase EpmA [Thermodesulfobacteriota bacterium]